MWPLPIPVTGESLSAGQPVVLLAGELGDGAVGGGSVEESEGALVDLRRSAAVDVLARRGSARPNATQGAGYALELNVCSDITYAKDKWLQLVGCKSTDR